MGLAAAKNWKIGTLVVHEPYIPHKRSGSLQIKDTQLKTEWREIMIRDIGTQ